MPDRCPSSNALALSPERVSSLRELWPRYKAGAILTAAGLALLWWADTERASFVGSIFTALLGVLGSGWLAFSAAQDVLLALQKHLRLEEPLRLKPRNLWVAHLLLGLWLALAGEHVLTEKLAQPVVESVTVLREMCSQRQGGAYGSTRYVEVDKSGNACFEIENPARHFNGSYPTFRVAVSAGGAGVPVQGRARAELLRHDSPLFGPKAYHQLRLAPAGLGELR